MGDVTDGAAVFTDVGLRLYNAISDINNVKNSDTYKKDIFLYIAGISKALVGAEKACFWKYDKKNNVFWSFSPNSASFRKEEDRMKRNADSGLLGKCLKVNKIIITNDPYGEPSFNAESDIKTGFATKSVMIVPVKDLYGGVIGAFELINKLDGSGNPDSSGFVEDRDLKNISMMLSYTTLLFESDIYMTEHIDELSGLKNKDAFTYDYAKYYKGLLMQDETICLFVGDIDKFKRTNMIYGKEAADIVITEIAGIISDKASNGSSAYRMSGDKFMLISPGVELEDFVRVAQSIRHEIRDTSIKAGEDMVNVTMSFGCIKLDKNLEIDENIKKAEELLESAKDSGRNKVMY